MAKQEKPEVVKKSRTSIKAMQNLKLQLPYLKEAIAGIEGESKRASLMLTYNALEKKVNNIKPESGTFLKQVKEAMKDGKTITIS